MRKQVAVALVMLVSLVTSLVAGVGDTKDVIVNAALQNGGKITVYEAGVSSQGVPYPAFTIATYADTTASVHVLVNGKAVACGASMNEIPVNARVLAMLKLQTSKDFKVVDIHGAVVYYVSEDSERFAQVVLFRDHPILMIEDADGTQHVQRIIAAFRAAYGTVLHSTPSPGPKSKLI
jgi:hypothetical protein